MQEENLFATPNRPKRIRLSVTRDWLAGEDVWVVEAAMYGTKSSEPVWMTTERFDGPAAAFIAEAVAQSRLAHSRHPRKWSSSPKLATQAEWVDHLNW